MDSERRQALFAEAARIHEKLGDTTAAIAGWQSVRDGDEGNAEALDELARLLGQQGNNQELVAVLEDRARFSDSREERAALFFRIGELRRGPLEDSEGAATSFKEVLDIVPDDRRALEALAQLEEKRGDFAALEEVLLRRLSVVEGGERVETLLALAKNAEHRLDDNDRAASYLHQILETDPVNREAYQALTRLLERGERWYDLIELYERRATAEGQRDPEAEIACRLAIAELWGRRLNDDDSARDAIQKVLELRPKHGPALLALAAVHERAEAWAEAAEALEKAAAASETAHDRAEVHFRRSRVLEAQGASDDQVEASLRSALEAEPVARRGAEGRRGAGAQAERLRPGWCSCWRRGRRWPPAPSASRCWRRSPPCTWARWRRPTGRSPR